MTGKPLILLPLAYFLILLAACSPARPSASHERTVQPEPFTGHGHAMHQHEPLSAGGALPGLSLYHLAGTWLDQHGRELQLAALRGQPVVAVMFYASCETACPILIRDAFRIAAELPETQRNSTHFLMITIDPETDAPQRMNRYVHDNGLDAENWHFLSGSEHQTRALASLLGVNYRAAGGGMFSHTNLITVLDSDGVVVHRTEGLAQPVAPAVAAISRESARFRGE
jgi:protein SCO1/2